MLSLQAENFHAITDCVCPGDVVTYECTVCGGRVTVWGGSAFQCANQEILLSNRNFGTSGASGVCNDGAIVGRGISAENDCYTSQLNITFTDGLQNSTIVCSVDNGTYSRAIGRDLLRKSTGKY